MTAGNTPIIVGVGQYTEHLDSPDYSALPPQHLAARAAAAALADTGVDYLAGQVDCLAAVALVVDSVADKIKTLVAPLGGPDLLPRPTSASWLSPIPKIHRLVNGLRVKIC